jgi:HD-like signal output (HDOD) protein
MSASKSPVPFYIDKNLEIPSIPLVLIKIIQSLSADTGSAQALEKLISHDPALAARILRLANSAFYSFHTTVKTISHAVSLLGIKVVTSLAIGVTVFDTFSKGLRSESALITKLWTHSCGVGLLAKELWVFNHHNRKEEEVAFLCGLLHDLGKVVLFKTYPNHYGSFFAIAKTEADHDISAYEVGNYGMDHAAIGELLAKQWGFPQELSVIIGKHHDASSLSDPLVRTVMAADLFIKHSGVGYDGDDGKSEEQANLYRQLNLSQKEYGYLSDYLSRERTNIEGFFRIS